MDEVLIKAKLRDMPIRELRRMWVKDLRLSPYRLERCALEQATLFEKWYALVEVFSAEVKDEERKLSKIRSLVDLHIRRLSPNKIAKMYGLPDLKEGAIKSLVETNRRVQEQTKVVNDLTFKLRLVKGAVEAARHRKSMIRELGGLYHDNYWDKSTAGLHPAKAAVSSKRKVK